MACDNIKLIHILVRISREKILEHTLLVFILVFATGFEV